MRKAERWVTGISSGVDHSSAQSLILVYCGNRGNRLFSFVVTSRALAGIADITEITELLR